jgi:hypothetical protein
MTKAMGVILLLGGVLSTSMTHAQVPGIDVKPYQVLAFNDLGMHCYDSDYSVFTILPPFNTIHAQVVRRGSIPRVQDASRVNLFYKARRDPSGSINTTSGKVQGVSKTNFWDHVLALFGLSLQVNHGIPVPPPDGPSARMPGPKNIPRPFIHGYDSGMKWFTAAGIPITQTDDRLRDNPYPLMRIEALKTGVQIGTVPIVVPVSNEMDCGNCHATGNMAANGDVQQQYGILDWSSSQDP